MSRYVSCAKCRTKDNDRFKLHKLNGMKTTFYINMHILHRKLLILFRFTEKKKFTHILTSSYF